jgi:hypothetical protein
MDAMATDRNIRSAAVVAEWLDEGPVEQASPGLATCYRYISILYHQRQMQTVRI